MSEPGRPHIVIVGGGQAAAQACQSLRDFGFAGGITLIGDEPDLPYQRPPLSKAYLKGEVAAERLTLKPAEWYAHNDIALKLGVRAIEINRANRSLSLSDGETLSYDALILATGARVRRLSVPGTDLGNVFYLRTRVDVDAIRGALDAPRRVVLIGAGFIGLEAAAACRQAGHDVVILEAAPRVLARVTSPELSAFYETQHRARGVEIRTSVNVAEIEGGGRATSTVRLETGETLPGDIVIIGVGIEPNMELAIAAQLQCERGILVGGDARTSDPRIFAIGDCASRPLELCARQGPLESVHNAIEQAKQAASLLCGRPRPRYECPWFWSDQFDLKLQIAGLSYGYDDVVAKSAGDKSFTVFYFRRGDLIAVDAVNAAPHFLLTKKALEAGARISKDLIAAEDFDARAAMKALKPVLGSSIQNWR